MLIDLAAGRDLRLEGASGDLVRSALEHRVAGLLWTRVEKGDVLVDTSSRNALLEADLRNWARHRVLWDALVRITGRFDDMGVQVASAKGVTAEARWYTRTGERPCTDIDLLLAPDDIPRVGQIVRELVPDHPFQNGLQDAIDSGHLQGVELLVDGIRIDLHLDLLKLEIIPTRQRELVWQRVIPFSLPGGVSLRVVDAETSLIHFLVHLNKDRFAYLLGYADIARICARESLDWSFIDRFLRAEGLETQVYLALDAVLGTLRLPAIAHPAVSGWRGTIWRSLWPPSFRLRGDVGRTTSRSRQFWLALTARGRTLEAMRGYIARLLPPPALAEHYTPDTRGPYLWRITAGRVRNARRRAERLARRQRERA